jgi:Flp pilus assembly protein TadG
LLGEAGNIAIIASLMLPILLAAFGMSFEGAHWYQARRQMQNAADSAALAASVNASSNYDAEAKAVTAQYGFTNGVNNVTVTVSNAATCPSGATNCYSVTITKPIALYLLPLVGYQGDTTIGTAPASRAKLLTASAVAQMGANPHDYCILALASSGTSPALRTNGAPKSDLQGCNVMSNTSADCNGHDLKAGFGDAFGTSSGCGTTQEANSPVVADPYLALAANIPANTCGGVYPQEPGKHGGTALPGTNILSGSLNWSGTKIFCGDVQLNGDVNLTTGSPGAVMVIENGQLDTGSATFKTLANSGLTIIFSGTSGSYTHAPTGGGTLDIAAPTSGTWSGVALYQDPTLTSGVDISAAGNSPTWDITGLVYLPHASVTFSGAVNKSSNGYSCFGLVVDNILINGTGSILDEGQCQQAGLVQPHGGPLTRGKLAR